MFLRSYFSRQYFNLNEEEKENYLEYLDKD